MLRRFGFAALLFALAAPARAAGPVPAVEFDLDGYFRVRGNYFQNLFDKEFPRDGGRDVTQWYVEDPDEDVPADFVSRWGETHPNGTTQRELVQGYCRLYPAQCRKAVLNPDRSGWFVMRGRFEPIVKFGQGLKLQATIDVFDNVVWGDNENLAATPLFAGESSNTQQDGTVVDSIRVKRLWVEWQTAFGLLRVGRQGSNWGLGILANDGNGFKNDFGDAYEGSSNDRIIFATRPITLVKGIAALATGKDTPNPASDPGLILAVGFDKLVESSAITFRRRVTDDEGVSDENATGDAFIRQSPIWLSDQGDDVLEMVYVLMFKRENWRIKNEAIDLTAGVYVVNRWQKETRSNVWIPDFHWNFRIRGFFTEGEFYKIVGTTEAISPQWDKTTKADITGLAARVGFENPSFTGLVEVGHASGDDAILDERFTGRALHQDYNVGLILFEQVMAQRTIEKFASQVETKGLWSKGGVYNSTYLNPRFKIRPGDIWEFRLGYLMAWADQVDGGILPYLTRDDGTEEGAGDITESRLLGVEIDFGIHMKWANERVLISLEGGYMRAGERLGRMSQYQDPATALSPLPYNQAQYRAIQRRLNNVFTLQSRFAFVF